MEIKTNEHKLATVKITVPINQIEPNPFNPNKMDDFTFQKMKRTIQEKGLFGSIITREYLGMYQIIDGEHRYKACKELGYTELPIENAGEMEENEVKFWTMYFNNTRGKDDIIKRAKLLQEMDNGQASLLPWTEDELANQKKLVEWSINDFNEQKEVKTKPNNLIHLIVKEPTYDCWQHCVQIAMRDGKKEEQMLLSMMDHYLAVNEGRAVGEKGLEF